MPRTFQIPVAGGGRLVTDVSAADIGPSDYVTKKNWRRDRDRERRREGWIKWEPLPAIANQYVFDAAADCLRIVELTRPNGTRAVIGFSRTAVKKFNTSTGAWDTIGSGYSSSGVRWQVLTMDGYLVANNAVDLPFYYRVEDAAVTPMYELREVGIASVGRICQYNSFLMIADIVEIQSGVLQLYMRGWSTFTTDATQAKAANFSINNTTENMDLFQVTTGAGTITATLPSAPPNGFYCKLEKVDAGAGSVVTSPVIETSPVSLTNQNDLALIFWDGAAGKWVAVTFPLGVVPADATYGTVPSYITNHLPWAIASGEAGDPTKWAPVFSVLMAAASTSIVLPFASSVFVAGQTRVAVVNGGPNGGTLGGQTTSPNGILVTAVSGRTLTLETTTDVAISYPRVIQIMRWTDVSSLVGRYLLQDDNSSITGLAVLRDWLVVTRETGIYMGRYTGDPAGPFVFTPKYYGPNVPLWGDAIANVRGDYLLYPSRGRRVHRFDGISPPELDPVCDPSASMFFSGVDETDEVFAFDNINTREWFFCYPETTMCVDYAGNTLSEFDAGLDAGAAVHKPLSTDEWVAIAIGRFVYVYGLVFGITPIHVWERDGVNVSAQLKFGLNAFGDQGNEKMFIAYTPLFASQSPDSSMEVQLYGTHNPNAALTTLLSPVESLPTPKGRNFVPLAFQYLYLQDLLTLTETDDIDVQFTGRIFEYELVKAGGVTRSID